MTATYLSQPSGGTMSDPNDFALSEEDLAVVSGGQAEEAAPGKTTIIIIEGD